MNDDDPQIIDLADVDPDVEPIDNYPLQSPSDPQGTTTVVSGLSVTRLIELAGADPMAVTQVEITNPNTGFPVVLTPEEVRQPSSFLNQLPAVFLDQTEAGFLRPLRTTDDMNADDAFTAPTGQALLVQISSPRPPLDVQARVSSTRTTVGKPVTFFVTATGSEPGEVLKARWRFGDGQTVKVPLGATPHVYRHARTYRGITVTVSGDKGSGGAATVAKVTVARRPAAHESDDDGAGNQPGGSGNQGGVAGSTTGGGQGGYTYDPPSYGNGPSVTPQTPSTQPTDPGQTVTGTVLGSTDQTASTGPANPHGSDGDPGSPESYTRLGAAAIGAVLLTFGALREFRSGRRNAAAPAQDEPAAEEETAEAEAKHER